MSGETVFLVPTVPPPGQFVLDGEEGRHAATVRRMRPGVQLVVCDGVGTSAVATVSTVARGSLTLDVATATTVPPPDLRVLLVQALPKGEHADRAVDLATEAGVDEIIPWQSERCVARWNGAADKARRGRDKWARTAREAAKQSRRRHVPIVRSLATTDEVASQISTAAGALLLHEAGTTPLPTAPLPQSGEVVLVVGPEGGLTATEVAQFEKAGATAIRLGPEVLRTSTAAAVALGALGVLTARWQ